MIIDKEVVVTVRPQNINWLRELGFNDVKISEKLLIDINLFRDNTNTFVNVKCDYCGKEWKRSYSEIIKGRKNINKDSCINCSKHKHKEVLQHKYGVSNISNLQGVRERATQTILERFGNFSAYHKKVTVDQIKDIVKENSNCTFISADIINFMKTYIDLKCICGNTFTVSLHEFKYGNKRQCNECGIKLKSGENHPAWKGGITSEDEKIRKSSEYKDWRKQVFDRDNYTCQCCGDNKGNNLHAHHIENFSNNEELRFDVGNGITFCNNCHNPNVYGSFHNIYGTYNNTKEQLEEFINNYKIMKFKEERMI